MVQYEIGTCYGCRKCMYCSCDLNIEKCECNKTVKPKKANRTEQVPYTFGRTFDEKLLPSKKTFIQTQNTLYSYNSNFKAKFNFTLCSTCNSQYQRLSKVTTSSQEKDPIIIDDESTSSSAVILDDNSDSSHANQIITSQNEHDNLYYEKDEKKEISFTFIVKKADGKSLPGKWLTFKVLSFNEFVNQIQKYIGTIVGYDDIDQEEYSLTFKPAKSNGEGLELSEPRDFEKFLNEYEKLFKAKKEIVVIANMKQKIHKKKKRKQMEV